jgi:sec-independent protein translocase protein TatA
MNLGMQEIIIILVVAAVVFGFGAKKLPDIGRGLGEGIRNFKKAFRGDDEEQKPGQTRTGDK